MRKQIIIDLESEWVLKHSDDDNLPIAVLRSELEDVESLDIGRGSFTTLYLFADDEDVDLHKLESKIVSIFKKKYPRASAKKVLSVQISDEDEREREARERAREAARREEENEKPADEAESKNATDGVIAEISKLVGVGEFKTLCAEIAVLTSEIKRKNTYEVFASQSYIFSIGDGCGLSTYLDLFGKLINKSGLLKLNRNPVKEVSLGAYREGAEPFEQAMHALDYSDGKTTKIICVDISEWMDRTNEKYFKLFLREIEKHSDIIAVFRVPFVDKALLERLKRSIGDVLCVRTVSFPPFGSEEIKNYAQAEFGRYGFTLAKPAWKYFLERISEEKSDGKFYGLNTVRKVVKELIYIKQLNNAKRGKADDNISQAEARLLCANAADADLSGSEQLARLVGSENIAKRIDEIVAQIEVSMADESVERPSIHMRFVGNPGTGKTTVARIIGKILKEKGILRVGNFYEYSGRDFCGRYIGETAPKTASICRDAYGSVLFIDEAYSLYRGDDGGRDYGREAIDTLIAEMENHRNDFIVIMAGYTDDMDTLMQGNLGLKSRMPYTIEFPNFTRQQLYEIFKLMADGKFKYEPKLLEAAKDYFESIGDGVINAKEFSNARFVRNLFERTWAKAAMRCQLNKKSEIVLTRDDFESAIAEKDFADMIKRKVGFN